MKSKFLEVALEAVKEAEKILLEVSESMDMQTETKGDGSPVTIADKRAEAKIIEVIKASFPDHGFLGEETGGHDGQSEYRWIIDPIDGTKNFTRGVPLYGTLLALEKNGEIIVGVSNVPLLGDLVYAERGQGAYYNGEKTKVSNVASLSDSYITSGGLNYFDRLGLIDKIIRLRDLSFQYRLIGDIYMYHLLVQGKIDGVVEASISYYDIAPFKLIIEEAGGKTSLLDGSEVHPELKTFMATNGRIHQELLDYFNN